MIYKTPFYAVSKALYAALNESDVNLEWFDSSVPIHEIEAHFRKQSEFQYGVFTTATADTLSNKDAIVWDSTIGIEIYSNYKGRKVISQKLEAVLNYLSTGECWQKLSLALHNEGFSLIEITVGRLAVNLPIVGDNGIWQSGSTEITFRLQQI